MLISWGTRTVGIEGSDFTPRVVEAPTHWSDRAVEQAARLYFRGSGGLRETSVRQLVDRIVGALTNHWAKRMPAVHVDADEKALKQMLLSQRVAFNTPVWVNLGYNPKPQCSACFIQSVDDNMESITDLQKMETLLFRAGSGTGTNWSTLRPRNWPLSGGGSSSGPVSFMMGYDAWAGVTKSGGSSRRAAKMCVLDVSHPDVLDFIESKVKAQQMIRDLISAGWDSHFDAPATSWARYQNANHSVRVSDAFMRAMMAGHDWNLCWQGKVLRTVPARQIWDKIVAAAHDCADPGLQFDDTINEWHTCKATTRINSSNPCSEYMFVDDSACNLASMNLVKYFDNEMKVEQQITSFLEDVHLILRSMDGIVDISSYPSEKITKNSHDYRPLGLGYANLGALLMRKGFSYDSVEGRELAAAITALMMAQCMKTSTFLAMEYGPFPKYKDNEASVQEVMRKHGECMRVQSMHIDRKNTLARTLIERAYQIFAEVMPLIESHGMRNAQLTLLAPTGTIGMVMDCDTTGIEPEAALVKYKNLAGGGSVPLVNHSIPVALRALYYSEDEINTLLEDMRETGELNVKEEHKSVFSTAFGSNRLSPESHVLMVAAVQPFLSGAVSKTVNLPADATEETVSRIYMLAWEHGLKAVSLYRDGSKGMQPLNAVSKKNTEAAGTTEIPAVLVPNEQGLRWGDRKHMPAERDAHIMKVTFNSEGSEHDFYCKVGKWPDGGVGEIWFESDGAAGSLLSGVLKLMGLGFSLALQHGTPLPKLLEKMRRSNFPPNGFTRDPTFPFATSFSDFFAQWLEQKFLAEKILVTPDIAMPSVGGNARTCTCGGAMYPDGTCWRCGSCGASSGSCGG